MTGLIGRFSVVTIGFVTIGPPGLSAIAIYPLTALSDMIIFIYDQSFFPEISAACVLGRRGRRRPGRAGGPWTPD